MLVKRFGQSGSYSVLCLLVVLGCFGGEGLAGPYSGADEEGISYDDSNIKAWATGCTGDRLDYVLFGDWQAAVGPAVPTSNLVVSLGDGVVGEGGNQKGYALLTFDVTIADGPGPDLAVFENALLVNGTENIFGELGFVEVSSNGQDFVRFSSHSLTPAAVGIFGTIDPTNINNLAGKHVNNEGGPWLGTPFDLAELNDHADVQSGLVDLLNINYVRIVDVIGDGSTFDGQGNPIYDPYPTGFAAGGFDLDAVAVLNTPPGPGDVDGDGSVDDKNLAIIINNWGRQNVARHEGDLNRNGTVEGSDYTEVLSHWTGSPAEPRGSMPEPSTLVSLLLAGVMCVSRRARERISKR